LGYIAPGHGFKGKQKWLCSDDYLNEMYEDHKGKKKGSDFVVFISAVHVEKIHHP